MGTDVLTTESGRRRLVEGVFAHIKAAGGTVSPYARQCYERYILGELTAVQTRGLVNERADDLSHGVLAAWRAMKA